MLNIEWKYVLLLADSFSGHRVKRRLQSGAMPEVLPGGSFMGPTWSASAPPTISFAPPAKPSSTYVFGFWSLKYLTEKPAVGLPVVPARTFTLTSDPTSMAVVQATAWYFWDFGPGGGEHGIYLDAFDVDAQDWLAQDFVMVEPDPQHTLTPLANEGVLTTTAEHILNDSVTIRALPTLTDPFSRRSFVQWLEIPTLTNSGSSPFGPPRIGVAPHNDEIVAYRGNIAVAIGLYGSELDLGFRRYEIPDPWWKQWVLRPPPIEDPRLLGAAGLIQAAGLVSGEIRARVLELAVEELRAERAGRSTPARPGPSKRGRGARDR